MKGDISSNFDVDDLDVKGMSDAEWRVFMHMSMKYLMKQFSNHLYHHWVVTIICASAALGGISSLIVGIMLFVMQKGIGG